MKNKNINSVIIASVATGVLASTTAYIMQQSNHKNSQNVKKYTGKAIKTVGSIVENVTDMIK